MNEDQASDASQLRRKHLFVKRFQIIIYMALAWILFGFLSAFGEGIARASEGALRPDGLFCFRFVEAGRTKLQLVKLGTEQAEYMFSVPMTNSVKPPFWLSDSIVVVATSGMIYKFDQKGEILLKGLPDGFEGAAGPAGALMDSNVFVTETTYDSEKKDWEYKLYILDLTSGSPVVREKFDIIRPLRVTRIKDQILVSDDRETQRLKIPRGQSTNSTIQK